MNVVGDKDLLKMLLQNLMDNAWKFTRGVENPSIEVGTKKQDGKTVYFVKDNGVGFDGNFADKVFVPFHRLHREGFDGTGVGLAIVQRVAQCHGGEVWAESAVGQGSTFYFTLSE
jgi:light-regulated signal transduction histidine kinase (bacteriophytochrome)